MFVAKAKIYNIEYQTTTVIILSKKEEEKYYKETPDMVYLYYERPLAKEILRAAAKDVIPSDFICNGTAYSLLEYIGGDNERIYNEYRKNHVEYKEPIKNNTIINVYKQKCRCFTCYKKFGFDNIESICGLILLEKIPNKRVEIDLQKCTRCKKYFIDETSLKQYERQYGRLKILIYKSPENEWDFEPEITFAKDSVLSRNGYSTSKSEKMRRSILVSMMECGIKKAEIIDKLSEFIRLRGNSCPEACRIWKQDLKFVHEYNLSNQKKEKL